MLLQEINKFLRGYKDLHCLAHAWVVIEAQDVSFVYRWRQEAEEGMRASGKSSLTDDQVDIARSRVDIRCALLSLWAAQ
jgi:pantothenate kinase-related protein Tda10